MTHEHILGFLCIYLQVNFVTVSNTVSVLSFMVFMFFTQQINITRVEQNLIHFQLLLLFLMTCSKVGSEDDKVSACSRPF
jgi:hypothetical protein